MYAHEHVILVNSGLRDERIIWTGDEEYFSTREAAQVSADRVKARCGLELDVYATDPE